MPIKLDAGQRARGVEILYPDAHQKNGTLPPAPTPKTAAEETRRWLLLNKPQRVAEAIIKQAEADSAKKNAQLRYPTDANTIVGPMPTNAPITEQQYTNDLENAVNEFNAKRRARIKSREQKIRFAIGAALAGLIAIGLAYGYLTLTNDGKEFVYSKRVDLNGLFRQGENYKYPRHGDMDRTVEDVKNPTVSDETEFFTYSKIFANADGTETWQEPKLNKGYTLSNRGNMIVELNGQLFMRYGVQRDEQK